MVDGFRQGRSTFDQTNQVVFGDQINVAGNYYAAPIKPGRPAPPAPPRDFVGRGEQLAALAAALTTGEAAIIALQGMGGIGKTALAQQLATVLQNEFAGGIFWADLNLHQGRAETVLRAWGAYGGLDLTQEPNVNVMAERVRAVLSQRRHAQGALLAVLDDVRPGWIEAARLLISCLPAQTPLLLTTRDQELATALGAAVWPVGGLTASEAHALLLARVMDGNLLRSEALVQRLLQELGHLPLAIRLAGAQIGTRGRLPGFGLATFVEKVAQRAAQTLMSKAEAGLEATFALSYDLLSARQRRVFAYLSVYGAPLLTIEHMAGLLDMEAEALQDDLNELTVAALLAWDADAGRYALHPLLRQYAYGKLGELDADVREVHKRAAVYLQAQVGRAADGAPEEALEEVDQWRQAQAWETMAERALALVGGLAKQGYWVEIEMRLAAAVAQFAEQPEHGALMAQLHKGLGMIHREQGRWREASEDYMASRRLFRLLGQQAQEALVLNELGYVYRRDRRFDDALKTYELALDLFGALGDPRGQGQALYGLGIVDIRRQNLQRAVERLEASLVYLGDADDLPAMAETYRGLGRAYRAQRRWQDAIRVHEEALAIYTQLPDPANEAKTLNRLSLVYSSQKQWPEAIDLLNKSLAIVRMQNDLAGEASTLRYLGHIERHRQAWAQALDQFQKSLHIFRALGASYDIGKTLDYIGDMYKELGGRKRAIDVWEEALPNLNLRSSRYQELVQKLQCLKG